MMLPLLIALSTINHDDFRIVRRTDPVDDTPSVYALIGDQREYLAIGCDFGADKNPHIVFQSRSFLGSAKRGILLGGRPFTYRVDDRPAVTEFWEYTDKTALETRARAVWRLADQLRGASSLYIRAVDYNYQEVDVSFDFSDPGPIINRALRECNVTRPK